MSKFQDEKSVAVVAAAVPNSAVKTAYQENIAKFQSIVSSLAILELSSDDEINPALMDHIKKLPHFPASTCKRHVYVFRRQDIESSKFIHEIFYNDQGEYKTYLAQEGYKFLLTWYIGGKNKEKFLQDTYNVKTVDIIFNVFENLIKCKSHEQIKDLVGSAIESLAKKEAINLAKIATINSWPDEKELSKDEEVAFKKDLESLKSNIGWFKEESRMYRDLSARILKGSLENYEDFMKDLSCLMQYLREDSKFLMASKQKDLDDRRSYGESERSCWSFPAAYLRSIQKKEPEAFAAIYDKREVFLRDGCEEILRSRSDLGRSPTRPASPRKSQAMAMAVASVEDVFDQKTP